MDQRPYEIMLAIEMLLRGVGFAWLLGKLYCDKEKRVFGTVFAYVVYEINYMSRIMGADIHHWISYLIIAVVLFFMTGKRSKQRAGFIIILIVLSYCVMYMNMLIVDPVNSYVLDLFTTHVTSHMYDVERIELIYILLAAATSIVRLGVYYLMMFMIFRRISVYIRNISGKEVVYLLLTPAAVMMFGRIVIRLLGIEKEETIFSLYIDYPMSMWLVPSIVTILFIGILISLSTYNSIQSLQEEQKKNFVEEQRLIALRNRIEEVEKFYDSAKRMKHEMRNYASTIKGLIAKKAYDEVDAYIDQIDQSMEGFEFSIRTGNAVTDVIINDARQKAEKTGIDFCAEFSFENDTGKPEHVKIEAFDMGIIVNNLLDNALEACRKQQDGEKQIRIIGNQKRRFFLLEVKNSFSGNVDINEKTGLPITSKETDISLHGIGLGNVKKVAEKYLGSMDIKTDQNMFMVSVILQGK